MEDEVLIEETESLDDVSTYSLNSGYQLVDSENYLRAVDKYTLDSNVYYINLYQGDNTQVDYVFAVPNEYINDIVVVNNNIYNFGTETIRLASVDSSNPYCYYEIIEIPVYGSEEYYRCLSEKSNYSVLNKDPQPFNTYSAINVDGYISLSEHVVDQPRFESVSSSMAFWPLDTIFLFIGLLFFISKSIFKR